MRACLTGFMLDKASERCDTPSHSVGFGGRHEIGHKFSSMVLPSSESLRLSRGYPPHPRLVHVLLWTFALLNYLYADVLALFDFVGSPNSAPHLPQWALLGSAVLMEIPIAMILRLDCLRLERTGWRISSRVALWPLPTVS